MTHTPTRWPFDIDMVQKGKTVMTAEQVDNYAKAPRESTKRRLAMLQLTRVLERGLKSRGIVGWTICEKAGALVVLSDSDATVYNEARTDEAKRSILAATFRQMHVDTTSLTQAEADQHERRLLRNSYLVQGMQDAQKQCRKALKDRENKQIE